MPGGDASVPPAMRRRVARYASDDRHRRWQTFARFELPLVWDGIVSALPRTIAHTLGEFGAVLMVGANISGETRTVRSIYDRAQTLLDNAGA